MPVNAGRKLGSNTTSALGKLNKDTGLESSAIAPAGPSRFSRKRIVDEQRAGRAIYPGGSGTEQTNAFGEVLTPADFCQKLLVEGFVQSYVDFYHLTHRPDPLAVPENSEGTLQQLIVSVNEMIFIRDNLVQAECARRQGDTDRVYQAFTKLAEHYARLSDFGTAVFFYEKCLDIATLTNDIRAEMVANHSLGTVYQSTGKNDDMAQKCHERQNELAESVDAHDEIIRANAELYKVYSVLAGKLCQDGLMNEALDFFNRALVSSKKSWNKAAEAEANGRIGTLLLSRGDAASSIQYLRCQSEIAADNGDAESRCKACSSLALAYDALGQSDKALAELTLVSSISEQAGDIMLQAEASRALGTLYSKVGQFPEAMEALQRHFNLLKQILSKQKQGQHIEEGKIITLRDIELARAYVGIAKGNLMMGSYVVAIQQDFNSILGWKLNRAALPKVTPPLFATESNEDVGEQQPLSGETQDQAQQDNTVDLPLTDAVSLTEENQ